MIRWQGIIRSLVLAVVLFFVLPALVMCVSFSSFGFTTDSFLVIFILFQCYIITLQVEIGLRQTAVFETEYEPALKPKILHEIIEDDVIAGVYLENVGSYPAYSLYVGLIDEIKAKSIDDLANRERGPKALSPGESLLLFSCQLSEYRSMHIKMNVVYVNILKKVGEIHFVKFPETEEFGMYVVSQRHGILLRSLEDLKLACSAIKWSRTVKRNG